MCVWVGEWVRGNMWVGGRGGGMDRRVCVYVCVGGWVGGTY